MSRVITYWLVMNIHEYLVRGGEQVYYCLDEQHQASETTNPKKALRFLTEEGAKVCAHSVGWHWSAIERSFPGDEPCVSNL